jgi:hypothetical protein
VSERRRFIARSVDVSDALAAFLEALAVSRLLDELEDQTLIEQSAEPLKDAAPQAPR